MKIGRKAQAAEKRQKLVEDLHMIFTKVRGTSTCYESFEKARSMVGVHIKRLQEKIPQESSFYFSALCDFNQKLQLDVQEGRIKFKKALCWCGRPVIKEAMCSVHLETQKTGRF